MNQIPPTDPGATRDQLGFLHAARDQFGFLEDFGFREERAEPTYLRFEKDDTFIEVFHGRASFELGLEVGRAVRVGDDDIEQKFHLVDVVPVLVPNISFIARTATTKNQVARFIEELAATSRPIVERLDHDGREAFDRISEHVAARSKEYLDGLRAARLRGRADDAWQRKDLASVIDTYKEIESELSTVKLRASEAKRLNYARRKIDEP